jgi:hypothetical protein
MEIFAILFSIPAAAVATFVYSQLIARAPVINRGRLLTTIRVFSGIVLGSIGLEIVMLLAIGTIHTRQLVGSSFYPVHTLLFLGGVPSLANLIVLGKKDGRSRWPYSVLPCTILGFVLVLMQYSVSEALNGIDVQGGPYSSRVGISRRNSTAASNTPLQPTAGKRGGLIGKPLGNLRHE